jgi:hypothetical protein
MRMARAVTLLVLIIEALVGGAFALGFYWLGGWQWGLLFSGVMLLLILLPWLGDLKIVFDSVGPKGAVKVGWWGRASFVDRKDATHLVVRVLGIPIRRRMEKVEEEPVEEPVSEDLSETDVPPTAEPAGEEDLPEEDSGEELEVQSEAGVERAPWWKRVDSETVDAFCRVIGSALGASCELVWGAEELRVSVQDPAEHEVADTVIEQVFGRRQVGPADIAVTNGPCKRRVRAIYRIGLLRAALAGVQVVIDGRVMQFVRRMKQARQQKRTVAEDERIIEQIMEQGMPCEEDED